MRGVLFLLLLSCGSRTDVGGGHSGDEPILPAETGFVRGTITLREGDCFPPTTPERCRMFGVSRDVWLYPPQHAMEGLGPRFPEKIDAKPVAHGRSDENGNYRIVAPVGHWSFFTEDQGRPYGCCWDSRNEEIDAVDIRLNEESKYSLVINHASD